MLKTQDDIEALIDLQGLAVVLDQISNICGEKADHIRSNWQDNVRAGAWERIGNAIDNIAYKARLRGLG